MNKITYFLLALFLILVSCTSKKKVQPEKPNFVIIFSDELQFDDISAFGGSIHTPNIDQLATEGILFENAFSTASMCTPSRFSVLTGQMPSRCIAPSYLKNNPDNEPANTAWNTWLVAENITVPRLLSTAGYVSGMAGKWHVSEADKNEMPQIDQTLSINSVEMDNQLKARQEFVIRQVKTTGGFDFAKSVVWSNNDNHPLKELQFHNFPWMTKGAIDFLEQAASGEKPFFLYLAPTSIHGPNHFADLDADKTFTPDGRIPDIEKYNFDEKALKQKLLKSPGAKRHRAAGMASLDYQVKLVVEKLKEKGVYDNTIIIFMSDHNIEPGKATCYEKGNHIPMIIKPIHSKTKGVKSSAMIQTIDMLPTLCEMAGVKLPENHMLDGKSIAQVLTNPEAKIREYIFTEGGYARSISDGVNKYIALRFPSPLIKKMENEEVTYVPSYVGPWPQAHSAIAIHSYPAYFNQNQLFNLLDDPKEQINLYGNDEMKDVQNRLKLALENQMKTFRYKYALDDILFMNSEEYPKLQKVNRDWDLNNIEWFVRDHGKKFEWTKY